MLNQNFHHLDGSKPEKQEYLFHTPDKYKFLNKL